MNAPTRAADLLEPKVELIPCASIAPSDTHIQQLRRKRYDMEGLANLAASIRKLGVQQPGIVRKLSALRGLASYEIVCGERRWRASRQADVAHFPAIVRSLTDAEVLEVQLVENIQRESLHPLEEAAGYDELMKVGKITADQVGDKVGLSRSWVYSRLNLLKLDEPARQALQDGRLDVSRALVVASVAQPNQRAEALKRALERSHDGKYLHSVRELRHKIGADQLTKPLTGAPFPIADATLLKDMGACGPCRFRTANCDPEALDPDVCTNLSCFHLKVKAQADRVRQAAADAGRKILRGEDARKLSPSPLTVYGHVDLDNICEHDYFPEEEPKRPKDVDEAAWSAHAASLAWQERERLWQPRTYRALLEGTKYPSVLIECPKTKGLLRELVPFKEAQALLKKRGIDLPSYANKKRQSFQRSSTVAEKAETPAAAAKRAAAERERQIAEELGRLTTERVLAKIKAKHDGTVGVDELIHLADTQMQDMPEEVEQFLMKAFGLKKTGWQWEKALEKLSAKDLGRFISLGLAGCGMVDGYGRSGAIAKQLCERFKVDRKAIEKEVRAELTNAQAKK